MQYPCLDDMEWRDANLSTLEKWHPCFHAIHPELMQIAQQVTQLFEQYLDCMKQSSDESIDDLLSHVESEALAYFCNFILAELHKQRELNASEN